MSPTATRRTRRARPANSGQPRRTAAFDVSKVRSQMYGLGLEMSGHRLVYLDAAATTQRRRPVPS
jgi:hypothetical protein